MLLDGESGVAISYNPQLMIDSITNYFTSLSPVWFYTALFLSAYIENVFPPIPGDTVTVFGAYLVGRSHQGFTGVLISTTLGGVAGFITYYALGRLIHPEYFERKNFRFLPASGIRTAGSWFQRYGYWVVLVNRFFSGIRGVISLTAGIYRLSWSRVLILATIGCALWNVLLIWAGYALGANWKLVEHIFAQYNRILLILLVLAAAAWLLRKRLLGKRESD